MRFYCYNRFGYEGYFSEKDIVKAIYASWNIEADLFLLNEGIKKINPYKLISEQAQLVFCPYESNEFNSQLLEEFGYKMEDRRGYREIVDIKTGKIVRYDWDEVKQLT